MKILIIVAMEAELNGFLKKTTFEVVFINSFKVYYSKYNDHDIYLAKCEVGKVNAALLTTALILKIKPRYVLNVGIAGALIKDIKVLSTIVSTKVAYHDFDLTAFNLKVGQLDDHDVYFKASKKLLSLFNDEDVIKGLIVSGDQFMYRKDQLDKIKLYFPKALACDMEGCAIAHVSEYLKRKFLIIRTISDNIYHENQVDGYVDNKEKAIEIACSLTFKLIEKL